MNPQKRCFFVSPIGADGSEERKNSDRLIRYVIEPVCTPLGLLTERADHISTPGRITNQVAQALLNSDLVIADLTGLNPNVMYELGVRHGLRLPVVQMAVDGTKLPFDVLDIRTIFYTLELDSVDRAKESLHKTVQEAMEGKGQPYIDNRGPTSIQTLPGAPTSDRQSELLGALLDRSEEILRTLQTNHEDAKGYAFELYQAIKGVEEVKNAQVGAQLFTEMLTQGIQNPKGMRDFVKVMKSMQPKAGGNSQQAPLADGQDAETGV
ncbi:MAG: hypothetical protein ACRC8S_14515 [Fimbriiglobus sp.]